MKNVLALTNFIPPIHILQFYVNVPSLPIIYLYIGVISRNLKKPTLSMSKTLMDARNFVMEVGK